jgi:hypothetical protein
VTRFCLPRPELVGAHGWLPPEPFEYGWTSGVGCNRLRCVRCGGEVRGDVLPDALNRRYQCACRGYDVSEVILIQDYDDYHYMYPAIGQPHPYLGDWQCTGHPDLVLPAVLDGLPVAAATDWAALVRTAVLAPPFRPPGLDLNPEWLLRIYRLLGDHPARHDLARAVAASLDSDDARLVTAARQFFLYEPKAVPRG